MIHTVTAEPSQRPIGAIIFDLDGTLIDSSDGVVEAVNYSLRQVGSPEQPAHRIKQYIGFPLPEMYPAFSDAPIDELCSHFQEKAVNTIVAATQPLPAVTDTLAALRQHDVTLAIASTKIRLHIDGIIEKLGWQDYFDALVGGDEVDRFKPDPGAFLLALDRLNTQADTSIVVGDTINDILAAQAVPIECVAVRSPYSDSGELRAANPDHFLDTIADLPVLLQDRLTGRQESA
ncbi:HAD-IA family hydrolase [candidate division GN15 bacterium]|nr:HAD-IA family hydrolase [candidate division GN15 bacterium]